MMIYQEAVQRQAEERIRNRKASRDANQKQLDGLRQGKAFDWTKVEAPGRLAERARRLGLYEDASALLYDPTNIQIGKRVFERIIDANNLLGITFLSEGVRKAKAVGRIKLPAAGGSRLGTGFMISPRIMMTNNHVLGSRSEAGSATMEFDFFVREDGTNGPIIRFNLQPEAFFVTQVDLDFTLVAVEAVNSDGLQLSGRGWFPLAGPSGKAVVGERVSIIQHPNGDPQKVAVHDNKIVDVNFNDYFLHYETDTMGGSSGSPVLNIDWDLVALHHAAVGHSNEGIRISSIVSRLREILAQESTNTSVGVDPDLAAELMAAQEPPPELSSDRIESTPPSNYSSPSTNGDGTATWIVPVTLTLGVGKQTGMDKAVMQSAGDPGSRGATEIGPSTDGLDLSEAFKAIEDAEGRVYYSSAQDKQLKKDYYPDLDGLNKNELFRELSNLIAETHTKTLSYKSARLKYLYPWIDRREDRSRQLRGIYSNKVFDALELLKQEMLMEQQREQAIQRRVMHESLGAVDEVFLEALEAAHPFNCEHVVPQSWFNKKKQPKSDLHHLFTCEWGCNSFRGNKAYFEYGPEAFRENCGESHGGKFEPHYGKGAAARATLYFLLRYPGEIANSSKEMPKKRLQTLIHWAKKDKVDRWELHRNAEIQKVQGNRNPLIDFPELVDKINFELGWAK